MIVDQDPKGYYDKIVDEPNPEKKAFNLLLAILVVVLIASFSSIDLVGRICKYIKI